jgi:hypothetical protein
MKKLSLTAVLIISVMLAVSCNGCKKDKVVQYRSEERRVGKECRP